MRFHHSEYAYLFFLLIPWILLVGYEFYRKKRAWRDLADSSLRPKIVIESGKNHSWARHILKILAFIFLVFALMEPQWGYQEEEVSRRGGDLMILFDVSNSMLAQDVSPARLERARRKFKDLIDMLAGDRVGLIAFAGRSFLLAPLTLDYGILQIFVDELSTETIPVQGTDLAGALQLALKSFGEGGENHSILVITDGEDHSERLDQVAKDLEKKLVRVFVLGIGKPEGAPIPESQGGFKTDETGQVVTSKLEESALQQLALTTHGAYVRSVSSDDDLKQLYLNGIRRSENLEELKSSTKRIYQSRYYWPLGVALLGLVLERFLFLQGVREKS